MKSLRFFLLLVIISAGVTPSVSAQSQLEKDYSYVMEIPSIIAMESSPAHLYVLSDTEGMVVFRTQPDSLQWLYSSTGMEQRGNTVTADVRFAYLFGYNRRLTVLEPTSVLGVYSSTLLPERPNDAKRIDQDLYLALGTKGLGRLSLKTPASLDSTVTLLERSKLRNENIIDLEKTSNQLFVLSGQKKLFLFSASDRSLTLSRELSLLRELEHIFLQDNRLMGTDRDGNIYEVDNEGKMSKLGSIGESVQKILKWNSWLLIKGNSNRIWTSYQNRAPVLWKDDEKAGNYITVFKNQLWLSEYNQISRIGSSRPSEEPVANSNFSSSSGFKIEPIKDQVVPFPKPLILTLDLAKDLPPGQVQFAYQSDVQTAKIKGKGFYWQPKADDVGRHRFNVIATTSGGAADSASFSVEVRSFNSPPRFTPLRPLTIPVGEPFTLSLKALDPDGSDKGLIRYLGVDLPEGTSVNERTGKFSWTPSLRQVGSNQFRVIATDQYGAASSIDVSIRVIEPPEEERGK